MATQVASPNTVLQSSAIQATLVAQPSAQPAIPAAQSSAQSAYRNPARAPVTGQSPVVQANPVPARGRGSRRRPGNGPRPSLVGQKTPVDPEATLIPIPNRGFNPPFATTGAGRRRSPLNQRRYQISATEMQQRRDRRWPSNNQ